MSEVKKAALSTFTAATIASSALMLAADAAVSVVPNFGSNNVVTESTRLILLPKKYKIKLNLH